MSIKRTITAAATAVVSVAMIASVVGAQTPSIADLQAQINALLAQLQALQGGGTAAPAVTGTGACAGVSFTRSLAVGSTGSDVKCLQVLLNNNGYTVSTTGAGSPGAETTYFGSRTLAAVRAFQVAKGWTPANQVGPLTRGALNALLGTTGPIGPGPITPTGAGLSVQLAYDNPASGTVVDTQGVAPLAKFTFVNGDNAEVKVTSLKLKRVGISADATLVNVYLFDGAKRLTDSASVASTVINFNDSTGIFTVPAGGSKTISVLADIDGTAGETVAIQLVAAADVTSNASSVKGVFPVAGNYFSVADGSNLATFYFADQTNPTSPADASIDPQNDYAIWYDNAVVGTRAVNLNRIAFRVGGSINRQKDIQNFRLLIDGVQKGSAVANADSNDYVTFDLTSNPVQLETGTRVVKILADIIGGSNKNVYLSLRTAADVSVVDSQLNANLKIKRYNTSTNFTAEDSGTQSINSGTLTVTKMTTSPQGDVVDGANNQTLAKFELKAAGESVKIESLKVSATTSGADILELRNGALYANGVQIGSTADIIATAASGGASPYYTTYNFGSALIVAPGSPVTLEVRSDIYDGEGSTNHVGASDTIAINLEGSSSENNGYGLVSLSTVDIPSADKSGNTLTVRQGGLTLAKYTAYTDQTFVVPQTALKIGHFTLTANTTEAVNINTIEANLDDVMSTYGSNLYVKFGNETTSVKSTVTADNSWSVNYSLAAGETKDLIVYADIASGFSTGTGNVGVYVAGTTAQSAQSKTAGATGDQTNVEGQAIVFTSGSFTTAADGSTPLNQAVAGGQSVVAGKFKLTAKNDNYTLKEAKFTVAGTDATSAAINSLTLKDGATVLGTVPYDGGNDWYYLTGLNMAIPANTSKVLTAEYNLAVPYTDGKGGTADASTVTTGKNATLTLSVVKYADSQGTETSATVTKAANYTYIYRTVPTFTFVPVTGQGSGLTSGSEISLYSFSVKADAKGPVALKQIKFAVDITDNAGTATAPTLDTFKFFRGSTNLNSSVAIQDIGGTTLEDTTTNLDENDGTGVWVVFNTEEVIPAGTTYTYVLKARPQGFGVTASDPDSISVSIAEDSVPADGTDDGGTAGNNQTGYYLGATSTTGIQTLETYAGVGAKTGTGLTSNGNIIWSDNSAQLHDYAYDTTSADWFNSYLMESLPMTTVGITYNN